MTSIQQFARDMENVAMPVVPGVYLLFKDQALTYLGKSLDCYGRIRSHRQKGRDFDYALVSACPPADLDWVEQAMIAAFRPPQNKVHNRGRVVQIVQAAPEDEGLRMLSVAAAVEFARDFMLAGQVRQAVSSGDLPSTILRANVRATHRGVLLKDLKAWCERKQRERMPASPHLQTEGIGK